MKTFQPVSRVFSGETLIASIVRQGRPVRWLVYWSTTAEQLGARPAQSFESRRAAEAAAMEWTSHALRGQTAPRVETAR